MKDDRARMVTAAIAVVSGVAALTTVVAFVLRARNKSPKVLGSRLVSVCENAVHELERRIEGGAIIHLSRSA